MNENLIHHSDPPPRWLMLPESGADGEVGVVIKKIGGSYTVRINGRSLSCILSRRLICPNKATPCSSPKKSSRSGHQVDADIDINSVVVGDAIRLEETRPETGLIISVLPRRNKIARRSAVPMPSAHPFEQVIAANIDQVVPVIAAADPTPKWNLLDRYLVSAESAGIPALVCITKLDLAPEDLQDTFWQELDNYRRIGYPLVATSAVSGAGLEEIRQALSGRLSVLLGKSGVGKTSLLNSLHPGLGLRVSAVSQATGKGKHTTTHQEMFPIQQANVGQETSDYTGAVVDTPGLREFGLWEISQGDLALCFPEMSSLLGRCRFGLNCRHDEEPGCAIRKAVMAGQISPRRYQSYLHIKEEL